MRKQVEESTAAESARRATRPAAERDRKGRFSARRKRATVLRLLRGETYLRRRSPCHARGTDQLRGHVDLLRCSYNVIRPHRALQFGRETRTPAMQAGLVNAPMNWSDIFTAPAALYAFHVAVVRVPVAVQLMQTSPAALSSFSWPHEHRAAA